MIEMTNLIQSDDVPCGLFFILSRAAGNKIIMNVSNAKAEIISIHSIIAPDLITRSLQNKAPVKPGLQMPQTARLGINHRCS